MGIRLEGDGVVSLILDRPKVNAFDASMLTDLKDAIEQIEADDRVKGVLIRSEGRAFSAGLDLAALLGAERPEMTAFFDLFEATFVGLFACHKPVAAAVQGHAIAGGLILALASDFVAFQRGSYRLGLTELQVGVPFPDSAMQIVASAVPPRACRKLVYEAGLYGAQECFEWGIGDALVDDAVSAARAWLEMVTRRPSATFTQTKRRLRQAAHHQIVNGLGAAPIIDALISAPVQAALKATLHR